MEAHLARSLGTTRERFGADQKKEGRASQEKPPLLIYSPKVLIQITSVPDRVSQSPAVSQLIEIAQEAALSVRRLSQNPNKEVSQHH